MKAKDSGLADQFDKGILEFHRAVRQLPGIAQEGARKVLVRQMVESTRRVRFLSVVGSRPLSPRRLDPSDNLFDPLRAALLHREAGRLDEACWLVFLSVHFGKNGKSGWRLVRDVYGRLESGTLSDWERTSRDPGEFRRWLSDNEGRLKSTGGIHRAFGNHRKYQSLSAWSTNGTGAAVETYVAWVGPGRSHTVKFDGALAAADGNPRVAFDRLYRSLDSVASFGRMARFDYLTMLAKSELVPIQPGSTYMVGATGPYKGAKLLLGAAADEMSRRELDTVLVQLGDSLGVDMQVVEDALCNWQKSPTCFKPFRG